MTPVPVDAVLPWAADRYGLVPPLDVRLLRAYTNDVYAVRAGGDRFVLKLYGAGWRTAAEVAYEADLLAHLSVRGVPVARALPGRDRRTVQHLPTPDGPRVAALFEHATGAKPTPPFTPDLDERVGRAAAAMHRAADDFVARHPRPAMDAAFLLDRPAALVGPLLADRADRAAFLGVVARLGRAIRARAARGLDWGPCHGDLTLDNLHVAGDGQIIFYDFDSGGPGWRAADLPGWAALTPEAAPRAAAFLQGYRAARRLDPADVEAAPYLYAAVLVWGMQIDLERRVLAQGDDAVRAYLTAQADELGRWAAHLGVG
jgi:Ser/Thr protein kinase RdoA (MazF antagonist)